MEIDASFDQDSADIVKARLSQQIHDAARMGSSTGAPSSMMHFVKQLPESECHVAVAAGFQACASCCSLL